MEAAEEEIELVLDDPEPEPEPVLADDNLVSDDTEAASVASLAALNAAVASNIVTDVIGGRTVEQLCAELIRPLLRDWLDQNLPTMVETMVQAEISRLSGQVKD